MGVPLAGAVTGEWLRCYQKLALAKEVPVQPQMHDDRAWIVVSVPASSSQREVAATLEPGAEDISDREEKFEALIDQFEQTDDPIRDGMATVMLSFLAGLFVGEQEYEAIRDNLDLERWFHLPKSHERRIHGHRHAGIRLVLEGPTLVHALDAHAAHPGLISDNYFSRPAIIRIPGP